MKLTYTIATDFLSALVNGDESGLTDQECADLEQFERVVIFDHAEGGCGHWSYDTDESRDNFQICAVCGLLADCIRVTYNVIEGDE